MAYESYIICTTPRSGSTLLCKLLTKTGIAGHPESHFHRPSLTRWLETYDLSQVDFPSERAALNAVFQAARQQGTAQTGIFGLRMQRGSIGYFTEQVARLHPDLPQDRDRIQALFGRTLFIHLTRQNKLEQAISRVKATQTGLWHVSADGTELERTAPPQAPRYDYVEIERNLDELTTLDAAWDIWFEQENIQALPVFYEDLAADPNAVLAQILTALGLNPALAGDITPPVAKLADATNHDWAAQFLQERATHHSGD